ncbi:MAG: dihydrodipicolinate synthase family protein [Actinomycetota bacterium]|nr:dihydrodipicolinate synthase family protein [Actinomycetota bacterium]
MTALSGVHVALATAFDTDYSLNSDATAALADDLIERGIHGIVVNGSTGEFAALTVSERRQVVDAVLEATDGRVPVTVQVGAMTTQEAVAHAQHAAAAGASAAMLVCPYYEPIDDREVEAYFRDVAAVGLPLMIYNNPAATGWSMDPSLIARLSEIDEVCYIKDTTTDLSRMFRIRQLCGDRLQILSGQDSLALVGFLAGAQATVWGAPNATPEACVRLWELTVRDPDLEAARALWDALYPVMRFFEESGYVQAVKAGTNLRIDIGPPRHPALPLDDDRVGELKVLMERLASAVAVEPSHRV